MAVCNLFNRLNNTSGNFLMFSQYVEDITHDYVETDNYKVVPSKFVALNIDYSKIKKSVVLPNDEDLNVGIPKYFQNCFENSCAYGRDNYENWASNQSGVKQKTWTPEISSNLFWNCMFDGEFLHPVNYGSVKIVDEIMYYGDINMHSFNNHKGMGYGEIYCYIPTDASRKRCQVVCVTDNTDAITDGRNGDSSNINKFLHGHTDKSIENYPQTYYYGHDFNMSFEDELIGELLNDNTSKYYNVNTIVVLYDIFERVNDTWAKIYKCIPMGLYFTGMFENTSITNVITKHIHSLCTTGTSYGLRICTRFSVAPNGAVSNNFDITVDDNNYTNMCQLMTSMSENLSKMMDVVNSAQNTSQQYKDLLSIFKNNKTNVPYVKEINGKDYWFVNGRFVAEVGGDGYAGGCQQLAPETIQKRIDNLMDNNPDNDFSYIEDPNGCDCNPLSNWDLADALGVDYDGPEYGGGATGGDSGLGEVVTWDDLIGYEEALQQLTTNSK